MCREAPARARVAAKPRGSQGQQRPQPLAAGCDEMRGKLRDQRDRTIHPCDDHPIARFQIVTNHVDQGGQRVLAVVPPRTGHGRHA